ncbi:hypothetical protein MHB77_30435 [Paenibacillus sp. FSL K6-3166]|uniref:hypothetical protein n=1 Tax=Paenibacillus sp. FSL K6-3166 TaxID=2921492 RepID=UPI0030F6D2F7
MDNKISIIKRIIGELPIIHPNDQKWLLGELIERKNGLLEAFEITKSVDIKDRLDLIELAIGIMNVGSYRDINNADIIKNVYKSVLPPELLN